MPDLGSDVVTFLFTDVEGSTGLWGRHPGAMPSVLARQEAIVRESVAAGGGSVFKTVGDALCAAFPDVPEAVAAALIAQRRLEAEAWPLPERLRVRMALHAGPAELRDGDYLGLALSRAARVVAAGHGGQVLLSRAARDLAGDRLPGGVELRDLGEFRLKDLTEPERLFQLVASGLTSEFPPPRALDARRSTLPLAPTRLLGREEELRGLEGLFREGKARLVTLTGPGGCGKTRLALEAASRLASQFENGATAVFLATVTDDAWVGPAIARALGLREPGRGTPTEALTVHLRQQRLLLLLDNLEQVPGASLLVNEILDACPGVRVLATSRAPLRVRAERAFPVSPLPLPRDAAAEPGELARSPAITLFVDRARSVEPSFELTAIDAPAVAEICRRLDGLPLAIELAAARVRLLPPRAMARRMNRRLELLTGGPRDLPGRQRTLRDAIAWSDELLDPEARALFRRMALFVGGGRTEALESVCGPEATLETLSSLVDHNLLLRAEEPDGEPRFAMLETIREYALECLAESGEEPAVRERHGSHYLALAERVAPFLASESQTEWLARLGREQANLRAAMSWTLELGKGELAARFACALWRFWWIHGDLAEGTAWLERTMVIAQDVPGVLRVRVLNGAGALAFQQGRLERARGLHEEALRLARIAGERLEVSRSLANLGVVWSERGEDERARALFEEALAIDRELGDPRNLAHSFTNLALLLLYRGEAASARPLFEEGLRLRRELHDAHGVAITLNNLGMLLLREGNLEGAARSYAEGLGLARALDAPQILAKLLSNLADCERERGKTEWALDLYRESLGVARRLADRDVAASVALGLASMAMGDGDLARAAWLYGAVQTLREGGGYRMQSEEECEWRANVDRVRSALGEEAFAASWARGTAMNLEDLADLVLEERSAAGPAR